MLVGMSIEPNNVIEGATELIPHWLNVTDMPQQNMCFEFKKHKTRGPKMDRGFDRERRGSGTSVYKVRCIPPIRRQWKTAFSACVLS
jgi:hypothetical protein